MPTHPNGRRYSSYVALLQAEERTQWRAAIRQRRAASPKKSFLRQEILRLVQVGHNVKEISAIVGLSPSTVYYHLDLIRAAR